MPVLRCPACAAEIPAGAKFCPRCGATSPAAAGAATAGDEGEAPAAPVVDIGKLPAPVPVAGILFLVALVVGPAGIVAGIATGSSLLLYGGIAVAVGIVILLLLGLVF